MKINKKNLNSNDGGLQLEHTRLISRFAANQPLCDHFRRVFHLSHRDPTLLTSIPNELELNTPIDAVETLLCDVINNVVHPEI